MVHSDERAKDKGQGRGVARPERPGAWNLKGNRATVVDFGWQTVQKSQVAARKPRFRVLCRTCPKEELMRRCLVILGALLLSQVTLAAPGAVQQKRGKRLSPPAKASCQFSNGKGIDVNYSSPRMRGRKIFGGLVPFGRVWRVGANEATTFDTTTALMVGGKQVLAGNYTLFAVPNPASWTLIISKKTGEWGIPYPGKGYDFARVPMTVSKLQSKVEDFTISFAPQGTTCTMHFDWESTRASVRIGEKR